MTNAVETRIAQHTADANGPKKTFAGRYNCIFILYLEHFQYVNDAIRRETEIKGWDRQKKVTLITSVNPDWEFLSP